MNEPSGYREISDPAIMAIQPLVSVHMLAYRHERFLAEAIEGVIAQVCDFPIELIIAEDCSPDKTLAIALEYQRRHPHLIRIITGDRNVGMHANSARSMPAARGEYVAFCEGDDYWHHPRKLQMQVDIMSANPDMVVCHTDFDRKTRFRLRHNLHRLHPSQWLAQGDAYHALLMEWSIMTCTTMFRRDVLESFESTTYNNWNWPFGDRNRLLYASLVGKIGYIDKSTATFRKRYGSATNSGAATNLKMSLAAKECIELFILRNTVPNDIKIKTLSRLNRYVYLSAFHACKKDIMIKSYNGLRANGATSIYDFYALRRLAMAMRFPVWLAETIKRTKDRFLSAE